MQVHIGGKKKGGGISFFRLSPSARPAGVHIKSPATALSLPRGRRFISSRQHQKIPLGISARMRAHGFPLDNAWLRVNGFSRLCARTGAITSLAYTNAAMSPSSATVGALWSPFFSHVKKRVKRNGGAKFAGSKAYLSPEFYR